MTKSVKIQNNTISFKRKLKSDETYKISQSDKFFTVTIYKKPQIVNGVSSSTEDGHSVLFIDYDNVYRKVVLNDYKLLQELFGLPQAFLLTTSENKDYEGYSGNYHVICPIKLTDREVFNILSHTRCDSAYTNMPLRNKYRNWVLRISNKKNKDRPRFLMMIGEFSAMWNNKEVSGPHIKLLKKLYNNISKVPYTNIDKCKDVFLQTYEAS